MPFAPPKEDARPSRSAVMTCSNENLRMQQRWGQGTACCMHMMEQELRTMTMQLTPMLLCTNLMAKQQLGKGQSKVAEPFAIKDDPA